jgi:tetratricopeptide (TPR) repeat protein
MMLGNRGETAETFHETLRFLERARPHEYIFSCLSIYPGTRDFAEAEKAWLDREVFFTGRFQELKTPFDASEEDTAMMNTWFRENSGLRRMHRDTVGEREETLRLLGDHHAAHVDLAAALYDEGRWDDAEQHLRRALDLGFPCPGIAYNHLACIAKVRGDLDAMMELFSTAAKVDPQHYVLIKNVQAARAWFKAGGAGAGGAGKGLPLHLEVSHDFQLLERTVQPTLPGPLAEDFATWTAAPAAPHATGEATYTKTPDIEGSGKALDPRVRLPLV